MTRIGSGIWRLADPKVSLASVASMFLGASLWINEFPDYRADLSAGKRSLMVRLGRPRAARVFAFLMGAAFVSQTLLPLVGAPSGVWLGAIALPDAVAASRILWRVS